MTPLRVAINAWSLMSPQTGIGSYTRNLALALQRRDDVRPHFFYGFGWSQDLRPAAVPGMSVVKSWVKRLVPRPYAVTRFLQQRRFDRGVREHGFDLYHEPSFLPFRYSGPTVITVHDLSPLRYPETHPADRIRNVQERLPVAAAESAAIIVDSEFVKREVIELLGVAPGKITSIHLGVSPDFHPRDDADLTPCLSRHGLSRGGYMLAVGTLEPRKNLVRAIDAYAALPQAVRATMPFVIAGMKGWLAAELEQRIARHESRGEVRWLGYVTEADLPRIYAGARMLVYPSLYEGFGLPVLEAMASGIPVITTNRASLPEVAGKVGLTADPDDEAGMTALMRKLAEDPAECARLGRLGVARARQFTWDACAENTVRVYREARA